MEFAGDTQWQEKDTRRRCMQGRQSRIEVVISGVSLIELESSYQDKAVNIKALPFHL